MRPDAADRDRRLHHLLITHRRSATASAPSAVAAADIMSPFAVAFRSHPHDLPFVRGPGAAAVVYRLAGPLTFFGFLQRSVALLPGDIAKIAHNLRMSVLSSIQYLPHTCSWRVHWLDWSNLS